MKVIRIQDESGTVLAPTKHSYGDGGGEVIKRVSDKRHCQAPLVRQ